jgi:hypothetical protein
MKDMFADVMVVLVIFLLLMGIRVAYRYLFKGWWGGDKR